MGDKIELVRLAIRGLLTYPETQGRLGDGAAADAARAIAAVVVKETPGNASEHVAFAETLVNELTRQYDLRLAWIRSR